MTPAARAVIAELRSRRSARNIAGVRRFGIVTRHEVLGVPVPELRRLARAHRRDQVLAEELWASGLMEAMLVATFAADPARFTPAAMNRWLRACDAWNLTDSLAMLLAHSPHAERKAYEWSARRAEFARRTGYVLMATMAVHRKELPDAVFLRFLRSLRQGARDERNFVRKAVNWALRQIGKRNERLGRAALAEAARIQRLGTPAARWIAADALRELRARWA